MGVCRLRYNFLCFKWVHKGFDCSLNTWKSQNSPQAAWIFLYINFNKGQEEISASIGQLVSECTAQANSAFSSYSTWQEADILAY